MAVKPMSGESHLSIIQTTSSLTCHFDATQQTREEGTVAVHSLLAITVNKVQNSEVVEENSLILPCPFDNDAL
jgi:hypothetical protein